MTTKKINEKKHLGTEAFGIRVIGIVIVGIYGLSITALLNEWLLSTGIGCVYQSDEFRSVGMCH